MMSHSDRLEAAFTKEAWVGKAVSTAAKYLRKAPVWTKGKASLPLRHAAGRWMTDTGDVAARLGGFLSRKGKAGGKLSEFGRGLIDKGDTMHLEGLRQVGIADRIMPRLAPRTKFTGKGPVDWLEHTWNTKGEIGQRANPLTWGKGAYRRSAALAAMAGFGSDNPLVRAVSSAYLLPGGLTMGPVQGALSLAMVPSELRGMPKTPTTPRNFKYNNIVRNPQSLRRYT